MTRYTINIGDDFPLGGDQPAPGEHPASGRRRRHGVVLRVLFFLAVAAIVLAHPVKTLLVVGLVLLFRRSRLAAEWRHRVRDAWGRGAAHDWQGEARKWRDGWGTWQRRWDQRCGARRPAAQSERAAEQAEQHDRYRGFV